MIACVKSFLKNLLDEERREMENRFYLILSNVCEVPSCIPKSELVDALILFYWCEATNLCYYSFNELVTNMTQKGKGDKK